jgi:twitching motility protein PilT
MITPSKPNNKEFLHLLDLAIEAKASDLHIQYDVAPMIRVDGTLKPLSMPPYTVQKCNEMVADFLGESRLKQLMETLQEVDFSFSYEGFRLRCNVFLQRGVLSASLRFLSNQIRNIDELGVPPLIKQMTEQNQGLIIISGPTGHGKSTTLAALISHISAYRRGHIVTIEDPIEYVFENKKSIVTQREVGIDTPSFSSALRAAYREDPDVVLVGEMRDLETMEAALQIAETGHLVLTSLHTNSAAQSANRIIDVFPPHQQDQIRIMLSEVLLGIVSQRLIPKIAGGRALVTEVMIANPAVRSLIREGKTHQIPNLIMTSAAEGMVGLDKNLAELVSKGEIAIQDALAWSLDPKTLRTMIY